MIKSLKFKKNKFNRIKNLNIIRIIRLIVELFLFYTRGSWSIGFSLSRKNKTNYMTYRSFKTRTNVPRFPQNLTRL